MFTAQPPVDYHLHDTYWVVAHIHDVLFGGSVFAVFASFYFWYPKVTGRMMDETLARWHFAFNFVGFNLAFFPMHMLGLEGMPRRIASYSANEGWETLNKISTFGAYLIAVSILPFLYNLWKSKKGAVAGNDPWRANSLEWWTSSPPPVHNFDSLPPIRSERPVFDERLEREAEAAIAKGGTA
jgi:heme/copper-type cytochrome/quinol oxidase subunit 1